MTEKQNSGSDPTRPLLSKNDRNTTEHDGRRNRVTRRNSVNSLRSAFLSMLPDKVRSNLDSESPFDVDLSNATALSQGPLSLSKSINHGHRHGHLDTDTSIPVVVIYKNDIIEFNLIISLSRRGVSVGQDMSSIRSVGVI
jgi:hypothetical protein